MMGENEKNIEGENCGGTAVFPPPVSIYITGGRAGSNCPSIPAATRIHTHLKLHLNPPPPPFFAEEKHFVLRQCPDVRHCCGPGRGGFHMGRWDVLRVLPHWLRPAHGCHGKLLRSLDGVNTVAGVSRNTYCARRSPSSW